MSIVDWDPPGGCRVCFVGGHGHGPLYVNGTQEATCHASAGCCTAGEYIVTVGGTTSGTDMDGSLRNVVAPQKALTAAQVSEIAGGRIGVHADLSVTRFFRIARAAGLCPPLHHHGRASVMCVQYTKGDSGGCVCARAGRGRSVVGDTSRSGCDGAATRWNPTAVTTLGAGCRTRHWVHGERCVPWSTRL